MKTLLGLTFVLTIFISLSFASMPVEVAITGCVKDGRFTSEVTDFGTHKVEKDYKINVVEKDRKPIDLTSFNGKRVVIKGYLTPGDYLFTDRKTMTVIGDCKDKIASQKAKLPIDEQERLAKELFSEMSKTDSGKTDVFIRLYGRVIDECPDTERAQEAYWRLTNLYLQAFDKPDYIKVISLLEEAVKKYPNTPITPHYKQRLLRSYEETKQWQKAVALYEEELNINPEILSDPQNAATMIAYADALVGSGNKEKALKILNKVVGFGKKIEDWLLDIAKGKIDELKKTP